MNRKLMKQCLDALEGVADWVNSRTKEHPWDQFQRLGPAIEALKQELAKPEPEPVAWMMVNDNHRGHGRPLFHTPPPDWHITWRAVPLYLGLKNES